MTYLYDGQTKFSQITATTFSSFTAGVSAEFYCTPNASNTTITLPAAGNTGTTLKFTFDTLTAVNRYADIVITSAATFKTPFSAAAKSMRFWRPCDVTFMDNGSEWSAVGGSCFEIQPWLIGDTEGTLGHGLYEIIPFGNLSGAGVTGLIAGSAFVGRSVYPWGDIETTNWAAVSQTSGGEPLWGGTAVTRIRDEQGLVSLGGEALVPSSTSPQFIVLNFNSGANWDSSASWDNIYSNEATGETPLRSFNLTHKGGTDVMVMQWHTDGSNYTGSEIVLADSTDYTIISGWDGGSGAEAGYAGINDGSLTAMTETGTFTGTASVPSNPVCAFASKARWENGGTPLLPIEINSVFHYHGRNRWTDAEIDAFYACRAASNGKILL